MTSSTGFVAVFFPFDDCVILGKFLCESEFPVLKMRRRIVANIDGRRENWIFIYLECLMKYVILFEIFKVMKSKIKEVLEVK